MLTGLGLQFRALRQMIKARPPLKNSIKTIYFILYLEMVKGVTAPSPLVFALFSPPQWWKNSFNVLPNCHLLLGCHSHTFRQVLAQALQGLGPTPRDGFSHHTESVSMFATAAQLTIGLTLRSTRRHRCPPKDDPWFWTHGDLASREEGLWVLAPDSGQSFIYVFLSP